MTKDAPNATSMSSTSDGRMAPLPVEPEADRVMLMTVLVAKSPVSSVIIPSG